MNIIRFNLEPSASKRYQNTHFSMLNVELTIEELNDLIFDTIVLKYVVTVCLKLIQNRVLRNFRIFLNMFFCIIYVV